MSKEELGRLTLIQGALEGKYTVSFIARKLDISTRQVKKLKKALRERGEGAVIHGNSFRHPANYTDDGLRSRIIDLKRSGLYAETNFTYFRELLLEREHIEIGYTTLSTILKGAGIAELTPDNNAAERGIRPFVMGRKNWVMCGSPEGAKTSCALYSLIETARTRAGPYANNLNPYFT